MRSEVMRLLLVFIVWSTCGIAMHLESCQRVIGQELSEKDKSNLAGIDYKNKLHDGDIVAIQQKGAWRYARVQALPSQNCPNGLGVVNLRPADPARNADFNNYGGFVFHFKRVRKLAPVEPAKIQKTE